MIFYLYKIDIFIRFSLCWLNNYYLRYPSEDCSWYTNTSYLNQSILFKIQKFCGNHTCSFRERVYERDQQITNVIAVIILDKFIDPKTTYTPKDIDEDMLKLHNVSLTYM